MTKDLPDDEIPAGYFLRHFSAFTDWMAATEPNRILAVTWISETFDEVPIRQGMKSKSDKPVHGRRPDIRMRSSRGGCCSS